MAGAPTVGIGRLLKEGGRFFIPHHQRDYSWTEDELDQLFKDVNDAQDSSQREYFIGLMVFKPEGEREFTILDGQQRLATTIIILAAIRSWLTVRNYTRDFHQIQNDYIALREIGREEWETRLVLNESNNHCFERHVIRESPIEDIERELALLNRYDPNRRLLEAALFCRARVNEIGSSANDTSQGAQRLFDLVRYLEDNVKVVRLDVPGPSSSEPTYKGLKLKTFNEAQMDGLRLETASEQLGRSYVGQPTTYLSDMSKYTL